MVLNGETFALEDEVQRFFDIRPTWTPETRFEEAHALFDEVLPGNGSIFERLQAFRERYNLVSERLDWWLPLRSPWKPFPFHQFQ